jgi:hypothetical protein
MEPIVLTPRTRKEHEFIKQLLTKLKIESRPLTREEREDLGMAQLMRNADRTKKVSRALVINRLKS